MTPPTLHPPEAQPENPSSGEQAGIHARDREFMGLALDQAETALSAGDFPVGCIIADDTGVIVSGRRSGTADGTANEIDHAEITTLRKFYGLSAGTSHPSARRKGRYVPSRLTLYTTMEPCLMCFGAILISGIGRLVWAYEDVMGGAASLSRPSLSPLYSGNPIRIIPGFRRAESLELFRRFFRNSPAGYWEDSLLAAYTLRGGRETPG